MNMDEIVKLIKLKKELSGLSDVVVLDVLEKELKKFKIDPKLEELKKSDKKILIKEVRAKLRRLVGRFTIANKERLSLVEEENTENLLSSHSSSNERLLFYPELRKIISDLKIKSILDLGCGLNPLALANQNIEYYASDINSSDLEVVDAFFKKEGMKGKTFVLDIRKKPLIFPKTDLTLILKVFDIIETKGHKQAEYIIKTLDCKYILISFPTKTLSGKAMNHPQRGWIEQLLNRLQFKFKTFSSNNEIFYLVEK